MKDTPVQLLKSLIGGYFRQPFYGYGLNCHFVYLTIPGTRPLSMIKQNLFVLFIHNHKRSNSYLFKLP